jgi:hypothetical protein
MNTPESEAEDEDLATRSSHHLSCQEVDDMTFQQSKQFSFISDTYPERTFFVSTFSGTEGLSELYEFNITLYSSNPEIDSKAMLSNTAKFIIHWEEKQTITFHASSLILNSSRK